MKGEWNLTKCVSERRFRRGHDDDDNKVSSAHCVRQCSEEVHREGVRFYRPANGTPPPPSPFYRFDSFLLASL